MFPGTAYLLYRLYFWVQPAFLEGPSFAVHQHCPQSYPVLRCFTTWICYRLVNAMEVWTADMSPRHQWVQEAMRSTGVWGHMWHAASEGWPSLPHTAGGQEVSLTSNPQQSFFTGGLGPWQAAAPPWGWQQGQLTVASHQLGICKVLVRLWWGFIAAESSTQNSRGRTERFVCPGWRCWQLRCSELTAAWSWLPGFGRCRICVLPHCIWLCPHHVCSPCHRCLYTFPCRNLKIRHHSFLLKEWPFSPIPLLSFSVFATGWPGRLTIHLFLLIAFASVEILFVLVLVQASWKNIMPNMNSLWIASFSIF